MTKISNEMARSTGSNLSISPKKRQSKGAKPRLRAEDRRAQLVLIGLRTAAEKGLGRLVHADVAKAAKVATSTAFFYFPDREALVKAVILEVDRFYRAMAMQTHGSDKPPRQRIRDHLFVFADSIETDRDYALVWLEWTTLFRNEFGLWDMFVDFQNFVIGQFVKSIKAAQKEGTAHPRVSAINSARQMLAGAYMITQMKLMKRPRSALASYLDQSIEQALA